MNEYSGWFFTYRAFARHFGVHHLTGLTPLGWVVAALITLTLYKVIKHVVNNHRGKLLADSLRVPEGLHNGSEGTQS